MSCTMTGRLRHARRVRTGEAEMQPSITIHNARLHNLKNVSLSIPKGQFVVLTGLSGSGKSTLGFIFFIRKGCGSISNCWGC